MAWNSRGPSVGVKFHYSHYLPWASKTYIYFEGKSFIQKSRPTNQPTGIFTTSNTNQNPTKKRYQPTMFQPTHQSLSECLACASYGHGRSHAVAHILFAAGEPWRRSSWRLMLTEANVQRGTFCWAFLGAPNLGSNLLWRVHPHLVATPSSLFRIWKMAESLANTHHEAQPRPTSFGSISDLFGA